MRRALCWSQNLRPWTSSDRRSRRTASVAALRRHPVSVRRTGLLLPSLFGLPSNPVGGYLISNFVRSMKQEAHKRGRERRERRRSLPWMKLRAGEAGLDETTTVRDLAEDAAGGSDSYGAPIWGFSSPVAASIRCARSISHAAGGSDSSHARSASRLIRTSTPY